MKKKLIALVTALTLCAVVVVGATLAYFSTQTDDVYNVFTYDPKGDGYDPDPSVEEPNWPEGGGEIVPGTATPKDPQIVFNKPPADTDEEHMFYAAMIIRGNSNVKGNLTISETVDPTTGEVIVTKTGADKTIKPIDMKKMFDKSVHSFQRPLVGQIKDENGNMVPDPTRVRWQEVPQNVGLGYIGGWSDKFVYDVDSDGNIYAYYTLEMGKGHNQTDHVFTQVVTNENIHHFIEELPDDEKTNFMDIIVTGYIVSVTNDTEILYDASNNAYYNKWDSVKQAMMIAFPFEFPESELGGWDSTHTGGTKKPNYDYTYTAAEMNKLEDTNGDPIWNDNLSDYL